MLATIVGSAFAASVFSAAFPPCRISEIRTDSVPPLTNVEYVELTGIPGSALDGYALVIIGDDDDELGPALGNSGVIESVVPLDGVVVPADGGLLIHSSDLLPELPDVLADLHLEDADNLTVLLVRDCRGHRGDDLDFDDDGVLDVEPWSEISDGVALVWGEPGVASEQVYSTNWAGPNGGIFVFHAKRCLATDEWSSAGGYSYPAPNESAGVPNGPCAPTLCVGDVSVDGVVDATDLGILLGNWGQLGAMGDVDNDGIVGAADLGIVLGAWGPCEL
ncbi:MAG: hypothetical protein U0572_13200 [Phycisphaerales bacterium]